MEKKKKKNIRCCGVEIGMRLRIEPWEALQIQKTFRNVFCFEALALKDEH